MAILAGSAGLVALAASTSASQAAPWRGHSSSYVRIGSVPRVAKDAVALGKVPGSERIEVDVALRPRDPAQLARFASAVSTPGSPDFRHFLRPGAFGAAFGASASMVRATVAALKALGLHVDGVSSNRLIVKVSSTVALAERAFATRIVRYRLPSGHVVYQNLRAPRVLATVGRGIQAILGLDNLALARPESLASLRRPARPSDPGSATAAATVGPQPCADASAIAEADGSYTADQLASAYGFSDLYQAGDFGAGQTIAIYELEPDSQLDIHTYQTCYGTKAKMTYIRVDGGAGPGGGSGEAALDIEDVIGLAPQATLDIYQGPNNNIGPLDVFNAIVTKDLAKVVTTSWGICEAQDGGRAVEAAEANLFEEAAAQGQTVLAAAGDDGSFECTDTSNNVINEMAVEDPSSQPYVTGVGGTSLLSPGPRPTETAWDTGSGGGAGGGGMSSSWPMPAYQSNAAAKLHVVMRYSSPKPCDAPTGYCREVPDVSADADPNTGYVIYDYGMGGWLAIGGTSAAAPLWAALVALADAWPACSAGPVGFINPSLYAIAGGSEGSAALNDVTRGDNDLLYQGGARYQATFGYDLATGLGTPEGANPLGHGLVEQMCALPESGGAKYASPTKSSVSASRVTLKANGASLSIVTVSLRSANGAPLAAKRVILAGTVLAGAGPVATGPAAQITPKSSLTNAKGIVTFEVSDKLVQKVTYRATDLTDGVLLASLVTVSYVKR